MSFEAYKVAVRISLINEVSSGLLGISRQLIGTGKDVDALHARLEKLRKLTLVGGAISAGGIFGLGLIDKAIKPAEEYVHQLNIMNMAGMKQAEIAEAVGDAWKLAGQNVTTTATGNLKALLDLRNVTGSLQEAREFLPIMQRMQTVLAASKEGNISGAAGDLAFSAMKALDIRGAVNDPENLKRQADLMTRVIIGTQGRVTPEQFKSVFNYARQAKFSLSDDFAYKYLPTLMLENSSSGNGGGGGSRGVGPMLAAMYRVTNQGFINRKSLALWESLGEVSHGTALSTSTPGTVVAPLVDAALARSNPFEFNKLLVDKIYQKFGANMSDDLVVSKLTELYRGNQLAGSLAAEFFIKRKNFERDRALMEGTMSPDAAYNAAMSNDPATARRALSAAWENFETSLTLNIAPVLVPALMSLSKGLNDLGAWARANPNLTKNLVLGFGALSAAMAVGGPLLSGIALTRLAFGGLGGAASTAATAIGIGGAGTLVGGLLALGAAVGGLMWLFSSLPSNDRDEKNRPGMKFVRHGRGNAGEWVVDPTQSQEHAGHHWKSLGRAGGYWAGNDNGLGLGHQSFDPTPVPSLLQTIAPRHSKPIQVTVISKLNDKEIARAVTNVQSKEAERAAFNGVSFFDSNMNLAPVGR